MYNIFFQNSIHHVSSQLTKGTVNGQEYKGTKFYVNIPFYKIINPQNVEEYGNRLFKLITEMNAILESFNLVPTDIIDGPEGKRGWLISFKNRFIK
ncbi:hypothetical protein [Desulfitobacterium sp.]|uniref:hypothetical protein n=1 Tax=Desulfitobacterium sp. TaxID=49981 RepID=UPI002C2B6106|nr:hypothetical protein [Desulfitobacterium sp.]HVJ47647.1 hypothetical protein [Desulfitobacterium sp.]